MEKANPEFILLNAVDKLKTSPIKSRPSTGATMEAEKITVACLPSQEESDDDDVLLDNTDDVDNDKEMLNKI